MLRRGLLDARAYLRPYRKMRESPGTASRRLDDVESLWISTFRADDSEHSLVAVCRSSDSSSRVRSDLFKRHVLNAMTAFAKVVLVRSRFP